VDLGSLNLAALASTILGAFLAAWMGAALGFRRTRKERALTLRVAWHEAAITALAEYEEGLNALRNEALNALIIQRAGSLPAQPEPGQALPDLPRLFRPTPSQWAGVRTLEGAVRTKLRLGDVYTEGRTQIDCSVALSSGVNLVSSHWMDLGESPEIPWLNISSAANAAGRVRRALETSLRAFLEMEGFWGALLGPRYRRWRALKRLARIRKELNTPET